MLTRARIAGHPIHAMLIAFPVAFYTATVVTIFVFLATRDPFWYTVALYANIAGVVTAAVASAPGLVDLSGLERGSHARATGFRHAGFNIMGLVLFAGSAGSLWSNTETLDVTAPLILSILGMLATLAAGWLGWTLVQTHHVGVHTIADDETFHPPDTQMPASFRESYRAPLS